MSIRTGPSSTTDTLHVVTWNVQFGRRAEDAAVALVEHDALRGADIVLLQEMDEAGTALIAERVGLNYAYASAGIHPKSGREFGNAVLSPWRLADATIVELPHKSAIQGQHRLVVRATVDGPQVIDACSVHTEVPTLSAPKRLQQFAAIAEASHAWAPDHLVIGGDFNTITRRGIAAVDERMGTIGAVRASAGAGTTLRRGGREFTLDHVFARGLRPIESGVVHGLDASDHRPLWVRFRAEGDAAT